VFYHVITRRKFLFGCSTAVGALTLTPLSSLGMSARPGVGFQSLDQISYPALAGQINTLFRVRLCAGRTVDFKLLKAPLAPRTRVTLGRRLPGDVGNEKFSLIFSGPKDELIEPAIYRFEHEQLGRFDMYIGQIGTRAMDCVRYETVFNRPALAPAALQQCAGNYNQSKR
jgi:hypothetical protein